MPQLLIAARQTAAPVPCLLRLCQLVQAVARRSSYLALLEEQPAARRRLARLFADRAFLAERVIAQPLLLDDVLDPRIDQLPLKRTDISAEITRVLGTLDEREAEAELERINEFKASVAFRLGLAFNDGRADAVATARRLAALAESVICAVTGAGRARVESRSMAACRATVRALPCWATAASAARSWVSPPTWTWCLSTTAAGRRR